MNPYLPELFFLYVPDRYMNSTVTEARVLIVILSVEYSYSPSVTGEGYYLSIYLIGDDV